jgi:hypothetical protein
MVVVFKSYGFQNSHDSLIKNGDFGGNSNLNGGGSHIENADFGGYSNLKSV